jgi:hypothetical protein
MWIDENMRGIPAGLLMSNRRPTWIYLTAIATIVVLAVVAAVLLSR